MPLDKEQKTAINSIFKRISDAISEAVKPKSIDPTARFTIDIVVKRTRLGYGVSKQFGQKEKLKKLSKKYIQKRETFRGLDSLTRPRTSNLTLTGQMLKSMDVIRAPGGGVAIGPTGNRTDSKSNNAQIAGYQEKQGRTFNRVSYLEFNQILRFYRRTFGDLLGKKKLLR